MATVHVILLSRQLVENRGLRKTAEMARTLVHAKHDGEWKLLDATNQFGAVDCASCGRSVRSGEYMVHVDEEGSVWPRPKFCGQCVPMHNSCPDSPPAGCPLCTDREALYRALAARNPYRRETPPPPTPEELAHATRIVKGALDQVLREQSES